jgi:hypothetical protein
MSFRQAVGTCTSATDGLLMEKEMVAWSGGYT